MTARGLPDTLEPWWNSWASVTSWFDWEALAAIGTVGALFYLASGLRAQAAAQETLTKELALELESILAPILACTSELVRSVPWQLSGRFDIMGESGEFERALTLLDAIPHIELMQTGLAPFRRRAAEQVRSLAIAVAAPTPVHTSLTVVTAQAQICRLIDEIRSTAWRLQFRRAPWRWKLFRHFSTEDWRNYLPTGFSERLQQAVADQEKASIKSV